MLSLGDTFVLNDLLLKINELLPEKVWWKKKYLNL